jgi:hypothetical protein
MFVAVVAAITLLANTGKRVPAGTVRVAVVLSSKQRSATLPAPPIHRARHPERSVVSDGVTATTLLAGNNAVGLEGVKSGIHYL